MAQVYFNLYVLEYTCSQGIKFSQARFHVNPPFEVCIWCAGFLLFFFFSRNHHLCPMDHQAAYIYWINQHRQRVAFQHFGWEDRSILNLAKIEHANMASILTPNPLFSRQFTNNKSNNRTQTMNIQCIYVLYIHNLRSIVCNSSFTSQLHSRFPNEPMISGCAVDGNSSWVDMDGWLSTSLLTDRLYAQCYNRVTARCWKMHML